MLSISLINALLGIAVGARSSVWLLLLVAVMEFAALISGIVAAPSFSIPTFALLASPLLASLSLQLGYCLAAFGPHLLQATSIAGPPLSHRRP
jgi:hypothetical protein